MSASKPAIHFGRREGRHPLLSNIPNLEGERFFDFFHNDDLVHPHVGNVRFPNILFRNLVNSI